MEMDSHASVVFYLSFMGNRDGDVLRVLASYHCGPGSILARSYVG